MPFYEFSHGVEELRCILAVLLLRAPDLTVEISEAELAALPSCEIVTWRNPRAFSGFVRLVPADADDGITDAEIVEEPAEIGTAPRALPVGD